jgi:cupin fold WbuC family metalloprotein
MPRADHLEGLPIILRGKDLMALSEEARRRPRLRLNRNLHEMADPVHRLLNAVEPGSYIRPHRHRTAPRDETVVVVSGSLGLLLFDDVGAVTRSELLRPAPGPFLADIRAGVWHSFVSMEPGTVFFEAKAGPFVLPPPEDLAGWAPAEGEKPAAGLERNWREMIQKVHADFTGKGENPAITTEPG